MHIEKPIETVEIAVAADANYFDGLWVTVSSIAIHASRSCRLRFHVLDGGIFPSDLNLLEKRLPSLHADVEVVQHVIDDSVFEGFPPWAGNSKMTYARLLLPRLLPDSTYVIYSDCDILWTRDVLELWQKKK